MSQFDGNAFLPSVNCESHSVNRRLEGPVGWPHRTGPGRAHSLLAPPFWDEKLQIHHVLLLSCPVMFDFFATPWIGIFQGRILESVAISFLQGSPGSS